MPSSVALESLVRSRILVAIAGLSAPTLVRRIGIFMPCPCTMPLWPCYVPPAARCHTEAFETSSSTSEEDFPFGDILPPKQGMAELGEQGDLLPPAQGVGAPDIAGAAELSPAQGGREPSAFGDEDWDVLGTCRMDVAFMRLGLTIAGVALP